MSHPDDVAGGIGFVSGKIGDVSGKIGDVSGKIGDVSGKIGDVSGKIGDVSGKIGDVSGKIGDVSGKIGDVSGRTLSEIHASMMQVRQTETIGCLESKVNRLENEMFGLAQWLDARLSLLEANVPEGLRRILDVKDQRVNDVERRSAEGLNRLDERVKKLEAKP